MLSESPVPGHEVVALFGLVKPAMICLFLIGDVDCAGPSKEPLRTHFRGLSTKRVLIGLFLVGPWFVQLLDQAGLLHHPESHFMHAMVNLFSAIWALAVVGIALNGGLMQFHPGPSSAGKHMTARAANPICIPTYIAGLVRSRAELIMTDISYGLDMVQPT